MLQGWRYSTLCLKAAIMRAGEASRVLLARFLLDVLLEVLCALPYACGGLDRIYASVQWATTRVCKSAHLVCLLAGLASHLLRLLRCWSYASGKLQARSLGMSYLPNVSLVACVASSPFSIADASFCPTLMFTCP